MKKELCIGITKNYGKVIIEIELENTNSNHPKLDWESLLKISPENVIKLSITGHYRGGYGQIQDSIGDMEFTKQLVDDNTLNQLLEIWDKYHLNDIKAGTRLQTEFLEFAKTNPNLKWDNLNHYEFCLHILRQHQLMIDVESNPQRPYKYGSQWLFKSIPADVISFLTYLKSDSKAETRSDLLDWMIMEHIKFHIIPTNSNPDFMGNSNQMDHWICEFWKESNPKKIFKCHYSTGYGHRIGNRQMTNQEFGRQLNKWRRETYARFGIKYPFFKPPEEKVSLRELGFDCIVPTMVSSWSDFDSVPVPPMPDDVLNCVAREIRDCDNYGDWMEWANEFGFDLNNKKIRREAQKAFLTIEDNKERFEDVFRNFPYQFIE